MSIETNPRVEILPLLDYIKTVEEPSILCGPEGSITVSRRLFFCPNCKHQVDIGWPKRMRELRCPGCGLSFLLSHKEKGGTDKLYVRRDLVATLTHSISLFVKDCCVLGDSCLVPPPDLYEGYKKWCMETKSRSLGRNLFYGQLLINCSGVRKKSVGMDRQRRFAGIGLRDDTTA